VGKIVCKFVVFHHFSPGWKLKIAVWRTFLSSSYEPARLNVIELSSSDLNSISVGHSIPATELLDPAKGYFNQKNQLDLIFNIFPCGVPCQITNNQPAPKTRIDVL
jgi:hypothetical protein